MCRYLLVMAVCHFCERDMLEHRPCVESPVVFPDGSSLPQIPYGSEANEWPEGPCHDCGTPKGGFHHPSCDVEECGRCHGQLISCGCLDDPDDIIDDTVGRPHIPAEKVEQLLGPNRGRPTPDGVLEGILENIATVGWSAIAIGGGPCVCCGEDDHQGPDFLYTIGFSETWNAPELIIFGLPPQTAHSICRSAAEHLRAGGSFAADRVYGELANLPVALIEVPKDEFSGRLNYASALYGDDFKALQLVWPDPAGLFPWDQGFAEPLRADQPLLGCWRGETR